MHNRWPGFFWIAIAPRKPQRLPDFPPGYQNQGVGTSTENMHQVPKICTRSARLREPLKRGVSVHADSFHPMTNTATAVHRPTECPHCEWTPPAERTATVSWLSLARHLRAAHNDLAAAKSAHRAAHVAARSAPR